jgi:hypothetical protein
VVWLIGTLGRDLQNPHPEYLRKKKNKTRHYIPEDGNGKQFVTEEYGIDRVMSLSIN